MGHHLVYIFVQSSGGWLIQSHVGKRDGEDPHDTENYNVRILPRLL